MVEAPDSTRFPVPTGTRPPGAPRLLVVGAGGQVGRALMAEVAARPGADAPVAVGLDRSALDVTDRTEVEAAVARHRPDMIVNAAAYTAVDRAEEEPEKADAVNRGAVANLAAAAASTGAWLIHLSTDYVFDGRTTRPYVESDQPNPLGVYGRTKLAGEAEAMAWERSVVLRTSWVYGPTGSNFVLTMRRLAAERDELRVVADQIGRPTSALDLARGIVEVVRVGPVAGLYHLAAPDDASWWQFADAVVTQAGLADRVAVKAIGTADYPTAAARPADSRLDSDRFAATYRWRPAPWRRSLAEVSAILDGASSPLTPPSSADHRHRAEIGSP